MKIRSPKRLLIQSKKNLRLGVEHIGRGLLGRVYGPQSLPSTMWDAHPHRRIEPNSVISEAIASGQPFLAARYGNDELAALLTWRRQEEVNFLRGLTESVALGDPFFSYIRSKSRLKKRGLIPLNSKVISGFAQLYLSSSKGIDLLASWLPGEIFFSDLLEEARMCRLEELEPYRSEAPWTRALAGKKVLVVHPFADSIQRQYRDKYELLFPNTKVLPSFELQTLIPPRAHFGEVHDAVHWFELFQKTAISMKNLEFDVAIVGAGPFGLPLASEAKKLGKVAIHLGGATQILFGIIGSRWENDDLIRNLANEHWARPSTDETPPAKKRRMSESSYW